MTAVVCAGDPAAPRSDPFAHWFTAGKCSALNHLYRSKAADGRLLNSYDIGRMPDESKLKPAKHDEHLIVPIAQERLNAVYSSGWFYLYDPRARIAYRHTGGDSDVTFTIRFAGGPPPGVQTADLSAAHTTSGLKLGASAQSVVAELGHPYIVNGCGLQLYIYLQSPISEPNELEFTIRSGRVIEIFATSYG